MKADCGFPTGLGIDGASRLVMAGPTISVDIGFDVSWTPTKGKPPNPAVSGVGALIDTGATFSCIDYTLAEKLNLIHVDTQTMYGSDGKYESKFYSAQVHVPGLDFTIYGKFASVDLAAAGQTHQAILGRSFLRNMKMVYDGLTGKVALEYNKPQPLLPGLGGTTTPFGSILGGANPTK